ncbi:MAG: class II glutamine amidotransferase [Thermoproteota archaeon]
MCRMVGVISNQKIPASKFLLDSRCSLLEQAKLGKQGDGWGIGYYTEKGLSVVKSEKAIYDEAGRFASIARSINSNLFIAHVRKASNPRKLPKEVLISEKNSQPFFYKSYLFVHNGSIEIPDQVQESLGSYKDFVQGQNDSEILFWLVMKLIDEKGSVVDALKNLEAELWKIYEKSNTDARFPFSALNLILSDGKNLYVLNRFLYEPKVNSSFCFKETPYFVMTYNLEKDFLVVSSEKIYEGEWKVIGDKKILLAKVFAQKPEVEIVDA